MKSTALAGGGFMIGFSWLAGCKPSGPEALMMPKEWYKFNAYLKIGENGIVTIQSPNPEIGQNVKTSMPMIVADELDIDWKNVVVEQAPLDVANYTWQLAGGSRSISSSWKNLRTAGATAKHLLKQVAADTWKVPFEELTTEAGVIHHKKSNKSIGYGEVSSQAAKLPIPKDVKLKDVKDFTIIGTSKKNVDGMKIVTGQPLFGLDYKKEGMLIAMIAHPPAFGLKLKSFDATVSKTMPGIKDVFQINAYKKETLQSAFDNSFYNDIVVVVGKTTWEVLNAKKALKIEWEPIAASKQVRDIFGTKMEVVTPAGFENTTQHLERMHLASKGKVKEVRKDGDPKAAFKNASQVLERTYTAPFLAHNTMEPMNFFADVTADKAILTGPIQTPEMMEKSCAERLGLPLDKIEINLTRMGGGFGRRLYGHFLVEAAVISQKLNAPVKLIYTREDDMTSGIFRPTYHATYRAALDANKNLIGFHVIAGGIPESPLAANRFPAGAVDNYLAEDWSIPSNVTVGAFRAPRSNFIASAEQSFLDELAETMGKDPIEFRLELLKKAKDKPVGKDNDYDADRFMGVLNLVKEKSNWGKEIQGLSRGVSAYFCHQSYVAQVVDLAMKGTDAAIQKVTVAVDCGIVVNKDAAANMVEGATIDGIGQCMFSGMPIGEGGVPKHNNLNTYRLIRHKEAPKEVDVHFVKNEIDPTGLGEPPFPPVMAAVANALYKATGKRKYNQPYLLDVEKTIG